MEKLYVHIEKLLGCNEYIVVPGIGGFVLQQQPASIIDDRIIAPRKVISFNALMHHSDGLLVIEIARTERISYRKAQELLHHETELFKHQLHSNGSFVFGNFGTFHITDESNFVFVPNIEAAFIPSNYGLNDLQLPDYSKKQHQLEPTKQKLHSVKSIMRYAAVVALLISMLFISERHPAYPDAQSAAIVSLSKLTWAAKKQVQTDSALICDTTLQLTKDSVKSVITINTEAYHVIVASMPTLHSAENYCQLLTEMNYPTAKVLEPVKTYRVAIKSFADKEEAIQYMEKLRTTNKVFETAWVLCKK